MTSRTDSAGSLDTATKARPRKRPRQKRSQILVDRILTAAKELFERDGYAYVSTNRIAEHANISIGSVYQYFANCESIALAIYEEASARASLEMKRRAFEILSLPLEQSIPKHVSTLFDIFEADSFTLLQLIDEVPELRNAARSISFDNLIQAATITYLEHHFPHVDRKHIVRKAYIIGKSLIGTTRHFLEERPKNITRAAITRELTTMMVCYLETLEPKKSAS